MLHTPDILTHQLPLEARHELLDQTAEVVARHPEVAFCYAHGSLQTVSVFMSYRLCNESIMQRLYYAKAAGTVVSLRGISGCRTPLERESPKRGE